MERMDVILPVALFCVGIVALLWGGDQFVSAASWIAERTGVPPFVIGATVVSFATTLPELSVSLLATMDGAVDMAVGNAVGSVSANIGLILGISLVVLPGKVGDSSFGQKGLIMILSAFFLAAFSIDGRISVLESVLLLALLMSFIYLNINSMKMASKPGGLRAERTGRRKPGRRELFCNLSAFVLGLSAILLGAELLVDNGSRIARMLGASEALIGLTFVAIGTSLPELITTISAIAKRQSSLSVGNIIGSNIIDLTMILSCCSFASNGTLQVSMRTPSLDLLVTLILMLIAVVPAIRKKQFYRWQGVLLLVVYAGYMAWLGLSI